MDTKQIIAVIKAIIPKKSTLPILENVYLNGKELIVTDLEHTVIIPYKLKGINLCVPAARFSRILQTMENFTATQDTKKCKIRADNSETINKITFSADAEAITLTGEDPKEFLSHSRKVNFTNGSLVVSDIERIHRAAAFVSTDGLRPAMMNVLISKEIVGMDGHQMHYEKASSKFKKPFLLTTVTLRVLSIFEGAWTVKFVNHVKGGGEAMDGAKPFKADSVLFVNSKGVIVIQRYVDVSFPQYRSVIPSKEFATKGETGEVQIDVAEILKALHRALEYASTTTHGVKLIINSKSIHVIAEDVDFGSEYKKVVPVVKKTGDNIIIGFNAQYLINAFTKVKGVARVQYFGAKKAIVINGSHLVMPIRLFDAETEKIPEDSKPL